MSRTDRHRPWRVQVADPYEQHFYWYDQYCGRGQYNWIKMPLYITGCSSSRCMCKWPGWKPARADRRCRRHAEQRRLREALKGDLTIWDRRR